MAPQASSVVTTSQETRPEQHPASRVISRKTNRRHMTGDHHGRTAARATLPVRAVDEILGTHNPGDERGQRERPQLVKSGVDARG